jgi:hypothetical protein
MIIIELKHLISNRGSSLVETEAFHIVTDVTYFCAVSSKTPHFSDIIWQFNSAAKLVYIL